MYELGVVLSDEHLDDMGFDDFEKDSVSMVGARMDQYGLCRFLGSMVKDDLAWET